MAQHSSALVAFSGGAPLARAARQCSVGTGAAEGLRARAEMRDLSREEGSVCLLASEFRTQRRKEKSSSTTERGWRKGGGQGASRRKEGSMEVRQVLPETRSWNLIGAYCQPCPETGMQSTALASVPKE